MTPTPASSSSLLNEILTVSDVAQLLKFSKGQVYDLTRSRAKVRQTLPIPTLRINGNLRFRRKDIEAWLEKLAEDGYSGEGEHRFRREGERHSGAKVNSSRSEATLAW